MPCAIASPDEVTPERRPYQPVGSAKRLLLCRDKELVIAGPAGTGKSRACLEKLYLCAMKYPGSRSLMLRRTRVSLTESALVTFEAKVVPAGDPILAGAGRSMRQAYRFRNGSTIVCGGLDDPAKVFSTEFDLIFVQEAIELDENGWESLTTRLRNNRMPYQQIFADTNPSSPSHWLKRRCDEGRATMLFARHEDNPALWDVRRKEWTRYGTDYLARLDALTGVRKERLRFGRWVQAEGVVYTEYDPAVHLIDPFDVPPHWSRYWVIDFGFTDPFVLERWAQDGDGRLYLYRERYQTGRLVEDHARDVMTEMGVRQPDGRNDWSKAREPRPRAVICDHDAEGRATFERHTGLVTTPAPKAIDAGIQLLASRLKIAGDGRPRLFVFKDALDGRDPALADAKKPIGFAEEIEGYAWDVRGGRRKGEVPVDKENHSMDCGRYLASYVDGPQAVTTWRVPTKK